MYEFLEPLVSNSELEWINPVDTGDSTSAPMLGILGDEMTSEEIRNNGIEFYGLIGCDPHNDGHNFAWWKHIIARFAFMDYQVRSVLEDLRDTGKVVFVSGE
jgi:hypothetical protein